MRAITAMSLAAFLAAGEAAAQETIAYDDGIPAGAFTGMAAGDIEAVAFTPAHPCRITAVRLWFTGTPAATDVYVWADYAGGWPDVDGDPLFHGEVTPSVGGWTEIPLPAGVTVDPPANFYVGQVMGTGDIQIAVDGSAPADGHLRSLLRIGPDWYVASDGDFLVRADVEYFGMVDTPIFTNVTEASGLSGVSPGRVAWGDYDSDGDDDLLVDGSRLFENEGGVFTDVTVAAGIRDSLGNLECGGNGGVWADYDNDGHLDFFSTSGGFVPSCDPGTDGDWYCDMFSDGAIPACLDGYCRNDGDPWPMHDCLFHNEGDGTFTVAPEAGSPFDYSPTEGAAWGDYDADGFVDLYVANYEQPTWWAGDDRLGVGTLDILWHNEGDGTFTDVSETALQGGCRAGSGRGVNWGDFDDDGRLDIFVSVYRLQPNCLWRNEGDGTFTDVAAEAGVKGIGDGAGGQSWGHTIGSQWMDFDNDRDLDLFSANLAHPRFIDFSDKSMLLVNSGPEPYSFADVREERGIVYQETHSEPSWGDWDNDGLPDLYITDVYVGQLSEMYRQLPDNTFEDATYETGTAVDNGWGAAFSDIDGDGDLDLVTRSLFRNDGEHEGHWLEVHLEGTTSNRSAIGARVDVSCGGVVRSRQVEGGKGTTNQNSLTLHFGLGDCSDIDLLYVVWPSGLVEYMTDVPVDARLDLVEGMVPQPDGETEPEPDDVTDAGSDDGPSDGGSGCGCLLAV